MSFMKRGGGEREREMAKNIHTQTSSGSETKKVCLMRAFHSLLVRVRVERKRECVYMCRGACA